MRKHGYYWVKFEELGWVVCNWNNFKWLVPGNFDDLKIDDIDERRIVRKNGLIHLIINWFNNGFRSPNKERSR